MLKPKKTWAGRNPQIDFVQLNEKGEPAIAIESKFVGVGSSKLSIGDVIWDLIRLELINFELGIKCYFVVAGKRKKINEFFTAKKFFDVDKKSALNQLLPTPEKFTGRLNILNCSAKRLSTFKKYLIQYKDLELPSIIRFNSVHFYPKSCSNFDNQVFVWEISSLRKKPRFTPARDKRISHLVSLSQ